MPRRIGSNRTSDRNKTFLRQWREKNNLTLERAASRFGMSGAQLSRIEVGKSPYTQDFLELAAVAYGTTVASLLMRDPSDPHGIWDIWDNASEGQRRALVEHAKVIIKTGTDR